MNCCIKITLVKSIAGLPEWVYDEHGAIHFDLQTDIKYSKTKKRKELSEFNSLKGFGILGFALPPTAKNNLILKRYFGKNNFNDSNSLEVIIYESSVIAKQTGLVYIKKTTNGFHEVQIVDGSVDWRKNLESCFVCELFEGQTYTLGKVQLESSWANDAFYTGSNNPFYFPLVDYGAFTSNSSVVVEDFHPELNLFYILEKALCKVGWQLKSPHLKSEEGRRLFIMALRESWWELPSGQNTSLYTEACYSSDEDIDDSDFVFNPDDLKTTGVYYQGGNNANIELFMNSMQPYETNVEICIDVKIENLENGTIQFNIVLLDVLGNEVSFNTYTISANSILTIRECHIVSMHPVNDQYTFEIRTFNQGLVVLEGSSLSVQPSVKKYYRGDTVILSEIIDCELTALDILKGYLHYINGKVTVDYISRCITLHVPESIETFQGEQIEGFHVDEMPIDLRGKVICESEEFTSNKFNGDRFCEFGFKDSTDEYIAKENLENLWGKTVDRGASQGYNEKIDKKRNPTFEPTAEKQLDSIYSFGVPPTIPVMWDNQDGVFSRKIGVRILYNYGLISQLIEQGAAGLKTWIFEGESQSALPYSTQCSNEIFVENNANVVYGDKPNDGYSRFHKQEFQDDQEGNRNYLIRITNCEFEMIDFRKPLLLNFKGCDFLLRSTEIKDFQKCKNISTPITGYLKTQLKCD